MAPAEGDDDFGLRSNAFISWLLANGATISPKIELADLRSRNAGRGIVATEDIGEDEALFSIPRVSILTVETSQLPSSIEAELKDPWLSLIASMIYEWHRGSSSSWKPYFDILPDTFDTLMFWDEADLKHLEGSTVLEKIGRSSADEAFQEQVIPILAPHVQGLSNDELLALCHRMGSTIMAYAFDIEKPDHKPTTDESTVEEWEEDDDDATMAKGMVPLADMLNADADRNNAKLFYEDDRVIMRTIKPVQAGEELFNDFGPLPTADLLRRYGYTTKNYSKWDVVELSTDLIRSVAKSKMQLSDSDLAGRIDYLNAQDVLDDGYDIARIGENQIPEELCVLLNTLTAEKAELEKLKTKDKLPKPALTQSSLELLYNVLVERRAMYPQTPDGMIIEGSHRQSMADAVIQGEKAVLREAADTLQSSLASQTKKRKADTFEEEAKALRKGSKR